MQRLFWLLPIIIIGLITAGCQNSTQVTAEARLPTLIQTPTRVTAVPMDTAITPAPTTATATSTRTPASLPTSTASATITNTPDRAPTETSTVTLAASPTLTLTPLPPDLPPRFVFGFSVDGRELIGHRFGDGGAVLLLVGGIHAGFEANTVELVDRLVSHFTANPADVLPGITLVMVPAFNPDGLAYGRQIRGRFNGNGVDLNRNWGCGWAPEAEFRLGVVDPGPQAFSEPETAALAGLINQIRPATVLFYHGAANGIYAGDCDDVQNSQAMVAIYGEATGYPYGEAFGAYTITGSGPSWVDSLGIPSADVELASADIPEFTRNLRGVMALQCWLIGEAAAAPVPGCS